MELQRNRLQTEAKVVNRKPGLTVVVSATVSILVELKGHKKIKFMELFRV